MFINAGARSLLLKGERQKFLGEEWPQDSRNHSAARPHGGRASGCRKRAAVLGFRVIEDRQVESPKSTKEER